MSKESGYYDLEGCETPQADAVALHEKEGVEKLGWLKLQLGANVLRIVTQPHQYFGHTEDVMNGGVAYGQKAKCSRITGEECQLCDQSRSSRPRWILGVISRRWDENQPYLLDVGYNVFERLRNLALDSYWKDPSGYDINIKLSWNEGGTSEIYNVIPYPKAELTEAEQELKLKFNLEYMKELTRPPTNLELRTLIKEVGVTRIKDMRDSDEY